MNNFIKIEENLKYIVKELTNNETLRQLEERSGRSFDDQIALWTEWIEYASEYGIAYESIVATLQVREIVVSSALCIKLLELGILFGFVRDMDGI